MINQATLGQLGLYGTHLKVLDREDRINRFGYAMSDQAIDQLILRMLYRPDVHQLWSASPDGEIRGWGHLAAVEEASYELAVSVEPAWRRRGLADALLKEMLSWAKFHHVTEVFMHCIDDNLAIRRLAQKHHLETREHSLGEQTASLAIVEPDFLEMHFHRLREQAAILAEMGRLQGKLSSLWSGRLA